MTTLESSNTFATASIISRLNVLATPFGLGQMAVGLPEDSSYPGHSPRTNHFLPNRLDLPFHLVASNSILKPGGPLKWKAALLLLLTKVMKISRFTSLLLNVLRLSWPRLRHDRRLAFLPRPNLTPNLFTLSCSVAGYSSSSSFLF